ncbi:MAG: DoxX family protein [Bacteroidota bacterium]
MDYELPELLLLVPISGIFAFMSIKKLLGKMREKYKRWGYPIPFMYGQSILELVGVICLWVEDYQFLAAVSLAIVPFAAITTSTRYYEETRTYWLPALTFLLLGGLIWWNLRYG